MARCGMVPSPDEPILIAPGDLRAAARKSATFLASIFAGFTTSATGTRAIAARRPASALPGWSSSTTRGYCLTSLGQELLRLFLPLHVWSEKWAKAIAR